VSEISYQKFSDHFIAKEYLDLYLDTDDVDVSFQDGSELKPYYFEWSEPGTDTSPLNSTP